MGFVSQSNIMSAVGFSGWVEGSLEAGGEWESISMVSPEEGSVEGWETRCEASGSWEKSMWIFSNMCVARVTGSASLPSGARCGFCRMNQGCFLTSDKENRWEGSTLSMPRSRERVEAGSLCHSSSSGWPDVRTYSLNS